MANERDEETFFEKITRVDEVELVSGNSSLCENVIAAEYQCFSLLVTDNINRAK